MDHKLIPLYTISNGSYFRIPTLPQLFEKKDDEQVICLQDHFPDGALVVSMVPACRCRTTTGETFVKSWWDWVEEAP